MEYYKGKATHDSWRTFESSTDVKSEFLNKNLQEEVYVEQQTGFSITGKELNVLILWKPLYGLHQASWA
jgi:hypothetical protein